MNHRHLLVNYKIKLAIEGKLWFIYKENQIKRRQIRLSYTSTNRCKLLTTKTNFQFGFFDIIILQLICCMASTPKYTELKDLSQPLNQAIKDEAKSVEGSVTGEGQTLADPNQKVARPSIKGPFRPVRTGNIQGSIFAMLASALGTGCLNLPSRVAQLGILPFLIEITLIGLLSYCGMYMMERIIIKFKVVSYAQMVKRAYGQTIMRYAEAVLVLFPWGSSICLQVIFAKFAVQVMHDIFGFTLYVDRENQIYNSYGNFIRIIVSILNIVFNMKNFFLTDLSEMLASLGKFSVTGVMICAGFIIVTAVTGFTKVVGGEEIVYSSVFTMDYTNVIGVPQMNSRYFSMLLQGTCGIFFVFLNHQFIFPLISNLKKPTKKRVDKIFVYSQIEIYSIYVVIGIIGYLLLAQHIHIIPISSLVVSNIPTWPLLVGKVFIAASLYFCLPIQIFAAREYLFEALDLQRNDANMKSINLAFIGSSFIIGLLFQGVSMYFGLIGGTVGVLMAGGIPLACFYKLIYCSQMDRLIMAYVTIMCILCFIGAMQSVFRPT